MNRHLNAEQRSAWACGDRPAAVQTHVEACRECRESVEAFDAALHGFRAAVTDWSAQTPLVRVATPQVRFWNRLTLVAATVTFGGLLSLGFLPGDPKPAPPEDAQLLSQIGAEISREVPGPMEPLLNLIDDNATGETARNGEPQ